MRAESPNPIACKWLFTGIQFNRASWADVLKMFLLPAWLWARETNFSEKSKVKTGFIRATRSGF